MHFCLSHTRQWSIQGPSVPSHKMLQLASAPPSTKTPAPGMLSMTREHESPNSFVLLTSSNTIPLSQTMLVISINTPCCNSLYWIFFNDYQVLGEALSTFNQIIFIKLHYCSGVEPRAGPSFINSFNHFIV